MEEVHLPGNLLLGPMTCVTCGLQWLLPEGVSGALAEGWGVLMSHIMGGSGTVCSVIVLPKSGQEPPPRTITALPRTS